MAKQSRRRKTKDSTEGYEKKTRSGIYTDEDNNILFVPTVSLFRFRQERSPRTVLISLGLSPDLWYDWQERFEKDHWLFGWLYGNKPPQNIQLRYKPKRKGPRERSLREDVFFLDREMVRFRKAASVWHTCKRLCADHDGSSGCTEGAISKLLLRFRSAEWFEDWMFGRKLPENVFILTESEIRKCREAWNYPEFFRTLGAASSKYSKWIDRFPPGAIYEWMLWLYGGPMPDGWYVVPESAYELKCRLSPGAVIKAAGVAQSAVLNNWRKDPIRSDALADAMKAFTHCQAKYVDTYLSQHSEAWKRLEETYSGTWSATGPLRRIKSAILRYAAQSTIEAACKDIGYSPSSWNDCRRKARDIGGPSLEAALVDFVMTSHTRRDRRGVVANGLFLPSKAMLQFRKKAREIAAQKRISMVKCRIPFGCFAKLFLDWTLPRTKAHFAADNTSHKDEPSAHSNSSLETESNSVSSRTNQHPGATHAALDDTTTRSSSKSNDTHIAKQYTGQQPVIMTQRVELFEPDEHPKIDGKRLPRLTRAQYKVVKAVAEAMDDEEPLTEARLCAKSGVDGARQRFTELRKKDPRWAAVLLPSGVRQLGYRIE